MTSTHSSEATLQSLHRSDLIVCSLFFYSALLQNKKLQHIHTHTQSQNTETIRNEYKKYENIIYDRRRWRCRCQKYFLKENSIYRSSVSTAQFNQNFVCLRNQRESPLSHQLNDRVTS